MKAPSLLANIGLISYLMICIVFFSHFCQAQNVPIITSFSPSSGFKGSTVTIRGPSFSNVAANNIVYFGAAKATVLSATTSRLEVVVPAGATFQPITVTVDGYTAYTREPFVLTFPNGGSLNETAFSAPTDFATGLKPISVSIGDLDGDSKSDISLVNAQGDNVSLYRNITNAGDAITSGSFAGKVDYTTGTLPRNIAIADLDSDGKLDLVVANQSTNTVSLYRNTSISGTLDAGSYAPRVELLTGPSSTYGVAIRDLDLDGKPDVVVTNYGDNTISVFRNNATPGNLTSGSFDVKVDFATGTHPSDVAIANLDEDHRPDIAVTNHDENTISLFRNTSIASGTISFASKVDFPTGINPIGLAIGDLDRDNKPDIVVSNLNSNTISVFRKTSSSLSSSSFEDKVDYATDLAPHIVALSDLDGDEKLDIVVSCSNSGTLNLFRNTAPTGEITASSFGPKIVLSSGASTTGLAIGDLNGDAKPELVAAAQDNNTVSVFQNITPTPPVITTLMPQSGLAGSLVTITGYNFSTTPTNNIVNFNGTPANIVSSSELSITATVPIGATNGPVTVTVAGQTGTSPYDFYICAVLPVTITPSAPSICSGSSITLTVIGDDTYVWSPAIGLSATTGNEVEANPAGTSTYTVTATDENGCINTSTVTVAVKNRPVITVSPSVQICAGTATLLGASGASTYSWIPATGLSATTGNSVEANPDSATTYTVTGTSANGCTNTGTVTVTLKNRPIVTVSPSQEICAGSSATLTASGANTHSWSPATGLSTTTGNSVEANPAATTTYTVTGTGTNGCTNTGTVTVTIKNRPTITVSPSRDICAGSSATLTASGANTYSWSPATGLSATTGNSVLTSPSATTTYTVTGTGANGCTNTGTVTVTIKNRPTITVSPSREICAGSSAIITASGANTYSWSPATGLSATTGNSVLTSPSTTTTYTVTGTDVNGCTNNTTVTITVKSLPEITVSPSLKICAGSSTTLAANGASTYSWSPATGLSAITGNSVEASPAVTTTYTVTGTDDSGCSSSAFSIITVVIVPKPTITVLNANSTTPTLVSSSISGNQWYKDGAVITASNTPSLVIESSGTYTVQVTQDDCVSPISDQFVVIITGIETTLNNERPRIFPNPANHLLHIEWEGFDESKLIDVSLIDVLGRTMVKKTMTSNEPLLDISALKQGHFLFQAKQNNKIIIMRFTKN